MKRFTSIFLSVIIALSVMAFTGCSAQVTLPDSNVELGIDIPADTLKEWYESATKPDKDSDKDSSKGDDKYYSKGWAEIGPVTATQAKNYLQLSFIVDVQAETRSQREDLVEKSIATVLKSFGIKDSQVSGVKVTNPPVNGYNYVVIQVKK